MQTQLCCALLRPPVLRNDENLLRAIREWAVSDPSALQLVFDALRHLKYNKHEVVLFHLLDKETEYFFNFENTPKRYIDVETGQRIDLYAENVREDYVEAISNFTETLKLNCAKYRIKYVDVDIREQFHKVMNTFMIERQGFV